MARMKNTAVSMGCTTQSGANGRARKGMKAAQKFK
jgi:hypothetical protein